MTHGGKSGARHPDDAIEQLLVRAEPRPTPPPEDEQLVREAVRAEWIATTRRHRMRQRVTRLSIAATVLVAAAVTFTALRTPQPSPVQVATIDKSRGSIYLQADSSAPIDERTSIVTGEVLDTGADENARD